MEKIIKNFVNYLFDFGLINVNSVKDFLTIYDKLNGKSFNVNNLLSTLLYEYFVNLNEGSLEKICDEVTSKFIDNEKTQKQKSLKNLIHSFNRVVLKNKQDCFNHFRLKIMTNFNLKKSTSISSIKKTPHSIKKDIEISKLSDIIDPKLKDDAKNCTFRPKINEYPEKELRDKKEIFSRLYNDSIIRKKHTDAKKVQKDHHESKKMTFSPKINNTHILEKSNSLAERNFFNRLEEYHRINNHKIAKITKEFDEKEKEECTFSPKILTRNHIISKKSASIRLYEDNTRRLKNLKYKESEYLRTFTKSNSTERQTKSVNYKKLENLYNDHKMKSKRIKDLKHSIDKEQGITFKPEITCNQNYDVKTSFKERNEKLLDNRRLHSLDYDIVKSSQGTLSQSESQRIQKEIVERLYNRDIEKYMKKKSSVVEEKKFDYQKELRNDINRFDKEGNLSPIRKLISVKSKSNLSIENNSYSNRLKNNSNFTFNNPTSGRSLGKNNYNFYFDEENNTNAKDYLEPKNQYGFKNKQSLIKEQSEREDDYADSLRQYNEQNKEKSDDDYQGGEEDL